MGNKLNTLVLSLILVVTIVVFIPASVDASGNVIDYLNQGNTQDQNLVGGTNEVVQSSPTTNNTWLFISAMVKLVAATALIILIIYFGAKIITKNRNRMQSSQNMQTIAVHALGQNKTAQLIRIGKKIYVLGVGENINLIKELSVEESIEMYQYNDSQATDNSELNNSVSNQFDSIFKKKLSEFKARNSTPQHDRNENEREFL